MPALSARRPQLACRAGALAAAVALLGCGLGSPAGSREVQLSITEGYGSRPVAQTAHPVGSGDVTVLDLVAGVARVRTAPGGQIGSVDGRSGAWSVYINGVARVGAVAQAQVHPGDRVWLDRHAPGRTRAVVGSFPEPFLHGRSGKRLPVRVECSEPGAATCRRVSRLLTAAGAIAAQGGLQMSFTEHTLRVLVGPWSALRVDETAALLGKGPRYSGVFARFAATGRTLAVLDARGATQRTLAAGTGLVAATRLRGGQPVWLVTGTDEQGVAQATAALAENALVGRFALAVHGDLGVPLPYPPNGGARNARAGHSGA